MKSIVELRGYTEARSTALNGLFRSCKPLPITKFLHVINLPKASRRDRAAERTTPPPNLHTGQLGSLTFDNLGKGAAEMSNVRVNCVSRWMQEKKKKIRE